MPNSECRKPSYKRLQERGDSGTGTANSEAEKWALPSRNRDRAGGQAERAKSKTDARSSLVTCTLAVIFTFQATMICESASNSVLKSVYPNR